MLPVYRGEIAGRCLGVDTAAFDLDGNEVVGELGELVIRQPMPSMPVRLLGRPRTASATAPRTSTCTRASGARATGCASPRTGPASSPAAPTRRSTAAVSAWARASSTRSSRSSRRCYDSLVVHLEDDDGGAGRAPAVRASRDARRRPARADRRRAALAALAAPRAGHDRRRPGDPAHADRQEARGRRSSASCAARRPIGGSRGALAGPTAIDAFVQFSEGRGESMTVVQPGWRHRRSSARTARRQPRPALGDAAGALRGQPRRAAAALGERAPGPRLPGRARRRRRVGQPDLGRGEPQGDVGRPGAAGPRPRARAAADASCRATRSTTRC